jgi:hypothetical protein
VSEVLQARGGVVGGAGRPTGERVIVRLDGEALDAIISAVRSATGVT